MANKTNCNINGTDYYRLTKTVGYRLDKRGHQRQEQVVFYGANKKEAMAKYEDYMAKKATGIDSKKQYFGIMADKWIYSFLVHDDRLADRTKEAYIGRWNKYVVTSDLYSMRLEDISALTLQDFYNTCPGPASAVSTIHKVMKLFYKYLEQEGYSRDYTRVLVAPKKKKPKSIEETELDVWSDEDLEKILNNFDKADPRFRLKFLLILATYTGCRISELLAITYDDISNNEIEINKQTVFRPSFAKGKKNTYKMDLDPPKTPSAYRRIPMNSIVQEALQEHIKWQKKDMRKHKYKTNFLFTTETGELYERRNIDRAVERYYKRIGVVPRGFHAYRRAFGTNLCKNGVPIQVTSKLMGHSDISVTAKYYVDIASDEKVDAVERLVGKAV